MPSASRGKLVTWKPDKGFGFIRPDEGGTDVFVHQRDFGDIERTPRVAYGIAVAFLLAVIVLAAATPLPWIIPPLYVVASLVAWLLHAFDKSAAMNQRWRTQEATLLLAGLLGGWPGALVAQQQFRRSLAC